MGRHSSGNPPLRNGSVPLLRGAGEKLVEVFGDALFDACLGFFACLTFGAAAVMALWGWHRQPTATAVAAALLVALIGYGVIVLVRPGRTQNGALAVVAGGAAAVFFLWLGYLVSYCSCV